MNPPTLRTFNYDRDTLGALLVGEMQGYKSNRNPQTRRILLLLSLSVFLQGRPALSQTTEIETNQKGPPNYGSPDVAGSKGEPSLDLGSQATQDERYQKALADYRAGKLEQAVHELRALDSAAARNALGVVLETMSDHRGALAAFQEALALQPDFPGAAYNEAKLLMREGRNWAAISQLQSALDRHRGRDDTTFSLQMLLVEAYAAVGQPKRAAEILEALLAEKPDSAEVHFCRAMNYGSLDSFDAAVREYREGLRLKPHDSAGLMGLAKALLKLTKTSDATPCLEEYVRLKPNDAEGFYVLGCAWRDAGRPEEAAKAFSQAAQLSPEDYDIRYHLGKMLWQTGQLEAALSNFEAAKRLKPEEVEVRSSLARILWSLGRKEEAREETASVERLSQRQHQRDQSSYSLARGNLLLDQGDLNGAAELFREALKFDPESARARNNLGLALARLNDPQDARRELEKAIALDPKLALAYNALGTIYMQAEQISEAEAAFQKAIRVDPQYAEAKSNLGALYAKLGRNAEAVALFKEAVEDSPQYPQSYLNWGLVLASQGNLSRAKEMFEKALQLSPNLAEARKALQIVEETPSKQN